MALRFFHLDFQSLWLDELFSVVFSDSDLTISQIVATYADDVHPLGYPLLLHWWLGFFGDTGLAARALSAVFGVLGVAAMYAAGRWCFDLRTGAFAAVLTAVNAFHIAYSQAARAYTLVFVLGVLSYWAFIAVLERPGWKTAMAYGLVNAVAMYVHYYAFVVVFGQVAAALVIGLGRRWDWRRFRPILVAAVFAGLTMVPWLRPMLKVARMRDYWPARPKTFFFLEYFHEYFGSHLILSIAFGGLLIALPFLLVAGGGGSDRNGRTGSRVTASLLGVAVVVALLSAYLRSVLIVPMLIPRVTIVFLPALLLLIALSMSRLRPPMLGAAAAVGLAVVSVNGLFQSGYYNEPKKEQWREAVQYMVSAPDFDPEVDVCLATLAPGFQFYVDHFGTELRVEEADPQRLLAIVSGRSDVPRVWLLVARDENSVRSLRQDLSRGWVRTDRMEFLETSVERWEPEVSTREEPHDP